jgi:glutamate/tyrosine decarboxylase-like PLP-dependent enzyme
VGDKHIQCGRVIDILKLWTYLKGNGWDNIGKQVEAEHNLALYIKEYVLKHPRFELVIEEVDTFNVCFWIIPTKMHKADFKTDE